MGIDSSAFARALAGLRDRSAVLTREALRNNTGRFPPVVIMELLSNPTLTAGGRRLILSLPRLEFHEGTWERAGFLRGQYTRVKLKAAVADCLIAQSCIDHQIPLLTYDRDFRHFVGAGLQLM